MNSIEDLTGMPRKKFYNLALLTGSGAAIIGVIANYIMFNLNMQC